MPYNMHSTHLAHVANWHFVSVQVSMLMNSYRSPRQCSIR